MKNNGYKAVIYDCDGVMFDSFEANFTFYSLLLEQFGKPLLDRDDTQTMRMLHTYSNMDVIEYLFADDKQREEARAYAGNIGYRQLTPLMRMEDGLRETLELLSPRVALAVCTNRATSMEMLLDDFGLASYFTCVMTANKVQNPKPHPEPLLKVLAHYGLSPTEALFVGDSDVDRQSAQAADVPFVAYKTDLPALAHISRHQDILDILDGHRVTTSR
ncbi:MAG: HAD family hydrolase [Geobacteraceae bacterium]